SLVLRLAVSAGLVGWLATRVDLSEVATSMAAIGPLAVLAILALQFLNTVIKSYKWTRLLRADGIELSQREALSAYMVGTFFSVFLPTSVGGDLVRALETGRRTGKRLASLTSVAADRVLGFIAIGLMGAVALALFGSALDRRLRVSGAVVYLAVLAAGALLFAPWTLRLAGALRLERFPKVARVVRGTVESLTAYRRSGRLPELVALSVAAQAVVVIVVGILARGVGIDAPLSYFFVIVPLVSLVESIPVSVYGIGLRDVSYVYLLGLVGTEEEQAISLSILYVVVSLLYALSGGVVFALRRPAASHDRA
ncbi:MAG: lysylphosphatidylglycerol synthase transmembrane domain-containing protein, partial [Candidatus Binatia bacterium]